ncbi:MAG: FtsX-like permease family protein [Deltaproteobacteria bacterium]|nr:FtsX-like permease family protein [Deltaproteobacteria bacterium]
MHWVERNRNYINFTLSSLLRRKGKNFSLFLVYTLVVFVLSSVIFFSQAIRMEAETILQDAPQMVVQRMAAGRHEMIPVSYMDAIDHILGVRNVESRLWGYYYHQAAGANYTIIAKPDFQYADDEVIVGAGVKRTWESMSPEGLFFKAYNGDVLVMKIADAIDPESELVSSDLIVMSEATFRKLFGTPDGVATDLALTIRNETESPIIAEKIAQILPDTRTISRSEIVRTYAALFDLRSGYIIVILSMSILAFFIFAWDKATGLSAQEKAEIGILKALGWDTSDVLIMKFWEGTVISLTSFLVGVILAYLHVFFADATLFEHALKGWGALYPKFTLKPTVNAFQIATLFFLTVVPYSLITIFPTWSAASGDPDAVMRQA